MDETLLMCPVYQSQYKTLVTVISIIVDLSEDYSGLDYSILYLGPDQIEFDNLLLQIFPDIRYYRVFNDLPC